MAIIQLSKQTFRTLGYFQHFFTSLHPGQSMARTHTHTAVQSLHNYIPPVDAISVIILLSCKIGKKHQKIIINPRPQSIDTVTEETKVPAGSELERWMEETREVWRGGEKGIKSRQTIQVTTLYRKKVRDAIFTTWKSLVSCTWKQLFNQILI